MYMSQSQKIAVIVIHGLGKQHEDFAAIFSDYLLKIFTTVSGMKNPIASESIYSMQKKQPQSTNYDWGRFQLHLPCSILD